MIEKHYTTRELAELMSCSLDSVYRKARRGEIPSVWWGGERRYPASGIERYLAKSARLATAPTGDVIELRRRK